MEKKTYFENLHDAISQNNKKALAYRDGHAWNNKKRKTMKSHMPRGKAYIRLEAMRWKDTMGRFMKSGRELADKLREFHDEVSKVV